MSAGCNIPQVKEVAAVHRAQIEHAAKQAEDVVPVRRQSSSVGRRAWPAVGCFGSFALLWCVSSSQKSLVCRVGFRVFYPVSLTLHVD